jgi:hypothetical protein
MRLYKFGSGGGARAPSTLPLTYPLPLLSSIEEGAKSNSSCNLMERAEAEGGAPGGGGPRPPRGGRGGGGAPTPPPPQSRLGKRIRLSSVGPLSAHSLPTPKPQITRVKRKNPN